MASVRVSDARKRRRNHMITWPKLGSKRGLHVGINARRQGPSRAHSEPGYRMAFTLAHFSTMCVCSTRLKNYSWLILLIHQLINPFVFSIDFPNWNGRNADNFRDATHQLIAFQLSLFTGSFISSLLITYYVPGAVLVTWIQREGKQMLSLPSQSCYLSRRKGH